MIKAPTVVCGAAMALLMAGCSSTGGLQPGTSVAFEPPIQRSCADEPLESPIPFKPTSLSGFAQGTLYAVARYTVTADGSVADAVITSVALGEDARALSSRQLEDIREDIPPQIEANWRHAPGRVRVCERILSWHSFD